MRFVNVDDIPSLEQIIDVPKDDLIKVLQTCQRLQIICEENNGIGISAVQVGIPWKLFLVKGDGTCPFLKKNEYGYFVDCTYVNLDDEKLISLEGCLSLRSSDGRLRSFQVERFHNINLVGFRFKVDKMLTFEPINYTLSSNQQGIVFQHEIQHDQGILISDIGKEVFIW